MKGRTAKTLLALSIALLTAAGQDVKVLDAVKKAELKLAEKPDDPEANLTLGKYLAFVKGDWEGAIPHLSMGSDAILKAAAE